MKTEIWASSGLLPLMLIHSENELQPIKNNMKAALTYLNALWIEEPI